VIDEPGEYEVEGISVFGYQTYHDDSQGSKRGDNTIYVIQAEDLRVLHLGDLGHILADKLIDELDGIDVLMIPVGGVYTIDAAQATELVGKIDPTYVLPMHYRTSEHDDKAYGEMGTVEEFVKVIGQSTRQVESLNFSRGTLPTDSTEVVLFG